MTIGEQKEIINSFDGLISDTIRYQMIDDIDDIAGVIYSHLKFSNKLNKEQKDILINNFCMDYLYNFTEKNKPTSLSDACMKFQNDKNFAKTTISTYIDKYFPNDLKINDFNILCLGYSDELDINEENISYRLYQVLINSSYFTHEDKILVLNHLLSECKKDIDYLKRFEEIPCEEDFLDNLSQYDKQGDILMREIDNSKDFCIQLIEYYFQTYIQEDYQMRKFDHLCYSIIRNTKTLPTRLQIQRIYNKILEMDDLYDYKDLILNIIDLTGPEPELNLQDFFESTIDEETDYKLFINNTSYGMDVIEDYLKLFILELDEYNIELVNEIARRGLIDLIDVDVSTSKNIDNIKYYLSSYNREKSFFDICYSKYQISPKIITLCQKICLISDYYNNYSDHISNRQINNNIQLIKQESLSSLLEIFDSNVSFSNSCIENFIDQTLNSSKYHEGLCNDTKILERINPFFYLEQLNNKSYQKKISN